MDTVYRGLVESVQWRVLDSMLKKLIKSFFDYDIVGEFLDTEKSGHLRKKYIRKWHLKRR